MATTLEDLWRGLMCTRWTLSLELNEVVLRGPKAVDGIREEWHGTVDEAARALVLATDDKSCDEADALAALERAKDDATPPKPNRFDCSKLVSHYFHRSPTS